VKSERGKVKGEKGTVNGEWSLLSAHRLEMWEVEGCVSKFQISAALRRCEQEFRASANLKSYIKKRLRHPKSQAGRAKDTGISVL